MKFSSTSRGQAQERHTSLRLICSRWLEWRQELPRGGFAFYIITLICDSFLACDCGAVSGVIMATCALLPLIFGSRIQRIGAVLLLALAVYLAYIGHQRTTSLRERIERTRQLHQQ